MTIVKFYDNVADELLKFAVIVASYNGQKVFCKHRNRDTWEIPGGHREYGETILETARRELYEETGATLFSITPVCVYSVTADDNFDGQETFGMLYYAEITELEKELHSEIERISIMDQLPERWTYPEIQPQLLQKAIHALKWPQMRCKMILTTIRCQIQSFSESYIQSALPLFTDERARAFLGGPMPVNWAEKRLERWATEKSDSRYFAVTLRDGTFIGFIDISPYHEPEYQELSYLFLPEFWGYGYAFEACQAVLRYCEETLDLKTVVAETQSANTRSRALLERLGFTMVRQLERFEAMQCVYEKSKPFKQ